MVYGGGNLQVSYSDSHTVKVQANDRCAESVNVSVSSETSYIQIEDSDLKTCDQTIHIGVTALDEVVLNGRGNIVANEGFGPRSTFQCKIRGGGNLDVSALQGDSFTASIEGGGTMLLTVKKGTGRRYSGRWRN